MIGSRFFLFGKFYVSFVILYVMYLHVLFVAIGWVTRPPMEELEKLPKELKGTATL